MKYSEEGKQYHIGLKNGDVGEYVILPGDTKKMQKKLPNISITQSLLQITENIPPIQVT